MPALFSKLSTETVHTYGLVLLACGIDHQVRSNGDWWSIDVPSAHRPAACQAISEYLKENQSDSHSGQRRRLPPGEKTYSAAYVTAPLVLIHWALASTDNAQDFMDRLAADAGRIVSGSLYRCLTALLLHADWAHLLGNVVALVLFGTALAYSTGWGVAWLLILLSGAAGNLLTAFWYGQGHVSIGASTAVFAAVGLCAAVSFWRGFRTQAWSWRQFAPLAGGLALLGWLGSAPHTDLVAHMMGFVAGLATGLLWGWKMPLAKWPVQLAAVILAFGLVALSWVWGMGYNG